MKQNISKTVAGRLTTARLAAKATAQFSGHGGISLSAVNERGESARSVMITLVTLSTANQMSANGSVDDFSAPSASDPAAE